MDDPRPVDPRTVSGWSTPWLIVVGMLTGPIYLIFLLIAAAAWPFVHSLPDEEFA